MAEPKKPALQVENFPDYQVITQPNPLRKVMRRVDERDLDDPVARAEQALADLSGEFKNWMAEECERLAAAHASILRYGLSAQAREELLQRDEANAKQRSEED